MKNLSRIALLFSALFLSSCQWYANHHIHHQQGNIIQDDRVAQVRTGMSKRQVAEILGSPVYDSTFDPNRWVYIHTVKDGNRPIMKKKVIVVFRGGGVSQIIR